MSVRLLACSQDVGKAFNFLDKMLVRLFRLFDKLSGKAFWLVQKMSVRLLAC